MPDPFDREALLRMLTEHLGPDFPGFPANMLGGGGGGGAPMQGAQAPAFGGGPVAPGGGGPAFGGGPVGFDHHAVAQAYQDAFRRMAGRSKRPRNRRQEY